MSLLSEIVIEPKKSKTYLRLVLIIDLLTVIIIAYSSLNLFIKLILFIVITILFRSEWIHKSACSSIKKIQSIGTEWILEMNDGRKVNYTDSTILINNTIFQLIQFANPNRKKLVILFHDQVTEMQLRLFHLKSTQK